MYRKFIAVILILLLLAGCVQSPKPPVTDTSAATDTAETSETTESTEAEDMTSSSEETTEATSAPTETTAATEVTVVVDTTDSTEPAHSDLFLSYVSPDEMVRYFNEVCLDAEFVNSGNASVLQRWEATICYSIYGDPTDKDKEVLENFVAYLNTIEGFPGIREAEGIWEENLSIYFCDQQELMDRLGSHLWDVDGAFTFWYNNDIIYDATICIRTDLDQEVRNSVILEEIYNALGPAQDTDLRQESIIYSGYSIPQALHPIDKVILELLYHPSLSCGMTPAECEPAILSLYY